MISFVVPVLNEGERLSAFLGELRHRFPGAEIIVVDGGSRDQSVRAALDRADVVLVGEQGRAAQMNLGARIASHAWIAFLHADTVPDFSENELRALTQSPGRWAFCRVTLQGRSKGLVVVAWFMNLRSRMTMVATGDQMLMVRSDLFQDLGGFADIPLMEDVEICKRLRSKEAPVRHGLGVTSSGRRWDEQGLAATVLRMWALRLAFWLGVPPARLWEHYYGRHAPAASRDGVS